MQYVRSHDTCGDVWPHQGEADRDELSEELVGAHPLKALAEFTRSIGARIAISAATSLLPFHIDALAKAEAERPTAHSIGTLAGICSDPCDNLITRGTEMVASRSPLKRSQPAAPTPLTRSSHSNPPRF